MFKLYVNNLQIGNYDTMSQMMVSVANLSPMCVRETKWQGRTFRIFTYDW